MNGTTAPASPRRAPPPGPPAAATPPSRSGIAASDEEVFLRVEYISERSTRSALAMQKLAGLLAWGLLIWEAVEQGSVDSNTLLRDPRLEIANISVASCCLAPLLGMGAWFGGRVAATWRVVKRGTVRRRVTLLLTSLDLALTAVNNACYLAINVYSFMTPCGWFDTTPTVLNVVSLTAWNSALFLGISRPLTLLPPGSWERVHGRLRRWWGARSLRIRRCCACCARVPSAGVQQARPDVRAQRRGGDISDVKMAAWLHVAAFVLLWVPMQVLMIVTTVGLLGIFGANAAQQTSVAPSSADCREQAYLYGDCSNGGVYGKLSLVIGAIIVLQVAVFILLMLLVLTEYQALPYAPNRANNLIARLVLRTRLATSLFFMVALTLIFFLHTTSCSANLEIWLGLGPMNLSMTILVLVEAFFFSPAAASQQALKLHSSLQAFSWTEAAAPRVLQGRGFPEEPLFVLETALKVPRKPPKRRAAPASPRSNALSLSSPLPAQASYCCMHSYRHFTPESTMSSLQTTLALYGCTHYEWLREPQLDMNALLAWGPDALCIAFRGTKSMKNVKADAQFWRSPHPPERGTLLLGTKPLVHSGFQASWLQHGLDRQVLQRVREVLEGREHAAVQPFGCTVVRCCSQQHEALAAELEAAAAAARAAEAAAAGLDGDGEDGIEQELMAAAAAALEGSGATAAQPAGDGGAAAWRSAASGSGSGGEQRPVRLLVTGHSLGGAVATLCAFDLARLLPEWGFTTVVSPASSPACLEAVVSPAAAPGEPAQQAAAANSCPQPGEQPQGRRAVALQCYTFGAPRTGNHAFAREFCRLVPDSWAVVNDQDLVAKSAKFVILFKRPGHVCLINPRGDMIVNPSFLEGSVHRSSYRASIKQHLLMAYSQSFAAILRGQHLGKETSGGAEAVALLAANPAVRQLLLRPLAFRQASLRMYIKDGARASARKPAGGDGDAAAEAAAQPQVVVVGWAAPAPPPPEAEDLVGGVHDEGAGLVTQPSLALTAMQGLATALSNL